MQFDRYANRAAEVAADLVNICASGRGRGPATSRRPARAVASEGAVTVEAIRTVLADRAVPLEVRAGDVAAVERLAADLRGVFAAADLDDAIRRLNRLLAVTAMVPRVSTHDGRDPHLHVEPEHASVPQRLRANCLMGLAAVLCDGGTRRLGVCDALDCDRVYVDTSRNARRRFCSDTCGTRTHVAAHRARRSGA